MSITSTQPNMRKEALRLAKHGFRVFPLNGKIPVGGRGCLDASSDELQIESWWEKYPHANIGLATGKGIAVLDIDVRRDGHNSLSRLIAGQEWPATVTTKSGGGGRHYFFGVTHDMWVPNSKDRLGKGVELLYEGRYVVAPPSLHPISRQRYEWLRGPRDSACAQLPQWLLELNIQESGRSSWDKDKYTEEIKEGEGRNNFLTSYAGALRRNGATVGEIYDAIAARNARVCSPPLSEYWLKTIARSVSRYAPEDIMVTADFTDIGNGERFASYAKGSAIYVPGIGWHTWTGRRWRPDEGQIQEIAKRVVGEISNAGMDQKDNEELSKRLKSWYLRSSSMASLRNMCDSASTHVDMYTEASKLDNGPFLLNTVDGVFDLKKGVMDEHKAPRLLTKLSRVQYDPEAQCPLWDSFLGDILPDHTIRDYVQRAVGYSLSGSVAEQCFFLMYGTGSNGKSTFVQTIFYMMGNYALKMDTATIMSGARSSGAATPDLVRLRGPRFVVAAESGDGSKLNEAVIKDLTGEDTITARALYKSPIEFDPQLKLWVYSNYKPTVKGMDQGIWRRIRLIPFTATIRKPNKKMRLQLRTELPGIFNWAYRGFIEWEKYGLSEPQSIQDEVKEYRSSMDIVAEFIDEKCQTDSAYLNRSRDTTNFHEPSADLWDAFSRWQGELPRSEKLGRNRFYERLVELGYPRERLQAKGAKWQTPSFLGIQIRN